MPRIDAVLIATDVRAFLSVEGDSMIDARRYMIYKHVVILPSDNTFRNTSELLSAVNRLLGGQSKWFQHNEHHQRLL